MTKIKPVKIRLEASSFCQLRCPSCPTASKAIHPTVGSGFLKLKDFQRLLDQSPWLNEIELSNYGEIFLNPDLLGILEYAHKRNVALTVDNGANLNNVKESLLEGLVKYKLRSMSCSIDGASNDTYKIYRVNGNFETVIENIRTINFFKRKYHSEYPRLKWQFVVFGHNEHELSLARKLAKELDMELRVKLSWDSKFSPVQAQELIRKETGTASREEYKEKHGRDYMQKICHQLWDHPQINWDGKVLGCCRNFWGDFGGNFFRTGSQRVSTMRRLNSPGGMLLGKKPARKDIPCTMCDIYLSMRASGK